MPIIAKTNLVCSTSPSLLFADQLESTLVVLTVRRQASLHCHSLLGVQDPELTPHVSVSSLGTFTVQCQA